MAKTSILYLAALIVVIAHIGLIKAQAPPGVPTTENGNNNGNCIGDASVCKDTIRGNGNGNSNSGDSLKNGNNNGNCIGKCVNVITGNGNGNDNTVGSNGNKNGNCLGVCKNVTSGNGNGNRNDEEKRGTGNNNGNCIGICKDHEGGNNTNENHQGNCVGICKPGSKFKITGRLAAVITHWIFGKK